MRNVTMADRRLPIYILVDISGSMDGEPIQTVNNGIQQLVSDLRSEPQYIEIAWLSVIAFGDEARQVVPLTDLESFQVPEFCASGKTNLGAALTLLSECCNRDVRKRDDVVGFRGDYRPMVFVLTDGKNDVGDFDKGVRDFKSCKWDRYVFFTVGSNTDSSYLKRIDAEAVIHLDDIEGGTLSKYFRFWDDDSIRICSQSLKKQLPVYIAVDSSETMRGLPIESVHLGIRQLASDIQHFNCAGFVFLLDVMCFNDEITELVEPISSAQMELPTIKAKGRASIGRALKTLSDSAERNSSEWSLPPIVFIISADGRYADGYEDGLLAFQKQSWGRVVVCAAGNGADVESLRRIEKRNVVQLKDLRPTTLLSFFDWIAQAIKHMASEATGVVDR